MVQMAIDFWDNNIWAVVAVLAIIVAVISIWADMRRQKRKNLNDVGFMPWTLISFLSILMAFVATIFVIRSS